MLLSARPLEIGYCGYRSRKLLRQQTNCFQKKHRLSNAADALTWNQYCLSTGIKYLVVIASGIASGELCTAVVCVVRAPLARGGLAARTAKCLYAVAGRHRVCGAEPAGCASAYSRIRRRDAENIRQGIMRLQ
jgi:hypothetical protein